jgi:predicted nucleic acid-binding protein
MRLLCHNYILVETSALILRRFGMEAVRVFEQDIFPILRIIWVTKEVHSAAVSAHLMADRHILSLVDCVSFEVMRTVKTISTTLGKSTVIRKRRICLR